MKYKFKVTLTHTYTHTEDVDVHFDSSESIDDAKCEAENQARQFCCPSSFEAIFDGTDIDEISLTQADPEEGEEPIPVRCDKTEDLFS
jgi:hypothetical protein